MIEFINFPPSERRLILQKAAIRTGYPEVILEKDAWVCWALKILFSIDEVAKYLVFKGGTSLSKAYGVIHRFSEDIDLTIDKEILGHKSKDLEVMSGTARDKTLTELSSKAKVFVQQTIQKKLSDVFAGKLTETWNLEVDPNDSLSLLFHFPSVLSEERFNYISRYIKLEFGTRADTWPSDERILSSYMYESFPDLITDDQPFAVSVLSVERTFWEKATILHAEYYRPEGKTVQLRLARHYYDLYCLMTSSYGDAAIKNVMLLEHVARQKSLFFRAGWAKYNEARPGTLRLVPKEPRLEQLRGDYRLMREMFFQEPPEFSEIVRGLVELEDRINSSK